MQHRFRSLLSAATALAVVAGSLAVTAPAQAATRFTTRRVAKYLAPGAPPPFTCIPTRHQYVLDEQKDICLGYSDLDGPGWYPSIQPGAIEGLTHYITRSRQNYTETAQWWPTIRKPGRYEVWANWRASHNRAYETPYYIYSDAGNYLYKVNQFLDNEHFIGMRWAKLGTHVFKARRANSGKPTGGYVMVNNPDLAVHSESVDAVGFRYVGPAAPTIVRARNGYTRINLSWNAAIGQVRFYRIYRNTRNSHVGQVRVAVTRQRYWSDAKVSRNRTYYYWIVAVDGSGKKSPYSRAAAGKAVLPLRPAVPTGLKASTTHPNKIELQWNAAARAKSYVVYRTVTGSPAAVLGRTAALSFVDTVNGAGTLVDTKYTYWVRSMDIARQYSGFSVPAVGEAVTPAPAAPTNLAATTDTGGQIMLTWDAPASGTAPVSYEVYRADSTVTDPTDASVTMVGTPSASPFVDPTAGTYNYWVKSVGPNGLTSGFSGMVTGTSN